MAKEDKIVQFNSYVEVKLDRLYYLFDAETAEAGIFIEQRREKGKVYGVWGYDLRFKHVEFTEERFKELNTGERPDPRKILSCFQNELAPALEESLTCMIEVIQQLSKGG